MITSCRVQVPAFWGGPHCEVPSCGISGSRSASSLDLLLLPHHFPGKWLPWVLFWLEDSSPSTFTQPHRKVMLFIWCSPSADSTCAFSVLLLPCSPSSAHASLGADMQDYFLSRYKVGGKTTVSRFVHTHIFYICSFVHSWSTLGLHNKIPILWSSFSNGGSSSKLSLIKIVKWIAVSFLNKEVLMKA